MYSDNLLLNKTTMITLVTTESQSLHIIQTLLDISFRRKWVKEFQE